MGKRAKEHRKRVQKRNAKIKQQTDASNRFREKLVMQLIRDAEDRKAAEQKQTEVPDQSAIETETVKSEQIDQSETQTQD